MDIKRKISEAQGLTPTEQQLGISALAMGEDIRRLSIKEFAARTNVSVASVHRFCKKLGLEGFKDLKVELIRLATDATWISTFPSTPHPPLRRLWSAWRSSTRPRWPKHRSFSTPCSLTTPPSSSRTPDRSTSTRARTTSIQRECSAIACSRPARAPHATATSRHRCARRLPRIQTARRSLSPTAALRPTSRKSCRFSAVGMSRSSSSARLIARAFTLALPPTLR